MIFGEEGRGFLKNSFCGRNSRFSRSSSFNRADLATPGTTAADHVTMLVDRSLTVRDI